MSRYARVLERLNTSVSKSPEATSRTDVPSESSAADLLPRQRNWRQELERLRNAVVLANQLQGVQVILICGARADDGATSVAAHLALALAELDRTPVALADVGQSPSAVERWLNGALPGQPLKEILPPGSRLVVLQTQVRNLYVVAGAVGERSLSVLLQPLNVLRRLRERFKYVIVKAPPVIVHPDTALIATKVDGVILVAQAGKSRLDELEAAKAEFDRAGATVLGVVLSQCKEYLPKFLADYM